MKILSSAQIREIDAKTIAYEAISSLELMKRAANAFFNWFLGKYPDKSKKIHVFSGVGNNGGDGLLIAYLLTASGYDVSVNLVAYSDNFSEECAHYLRYVKTMGIPLLVIEKETDFPDLFTCDIIVDAIFGTGLSREITGIAATVIHKINHCEKTVISVDVPSGLFLNKKTDFAIQATQTVTFQIPKMALYMPENALFCGHTTLVDIGLSEKAMNEAHTTAFFTERKDIKRIIQPLMRFSHKGTQGHALIIGGSKGKMGSACLASKAALMSGCGLVTSYVPACGTHILQTNFPEGMVLEDVSEAYISDISMEVLPDAIGIGIGLGKHVETQQAFFRLLSCQQKPLVIDADALNILSEHKDWLLLLPPKSILTPHPKEFSRLVGVWSDWTDKINRAIGFSRDYNAILVLKGAYTLIIDHETLYMNSSGSPALATAGSGDVLTGIITGLLAQGYASIDAARIGVYLHGLTANVSKKEIHPRSFTASDILRYIGKAYAEIEK